MKTKLILLSSILFISFGCKKDKSIEPQCVEEFSFSNDVQPIIMNSCAVSGCHDAVTASNDMIFENYNAIFENRELISKAVKHESGVTAMPIGAELTQLEIQTITCWIAQGAPNN